jgi:hypothetical protein
MRGIGTAIPRPLAFFLFLRGATRANPATTKNVYGRFMRSVVDEGQNHQNKKSKENMGK